MPRARLPLLVAVVASAIVSGGPSSADEAAPRTPAADDAPRAPAAPAAPRPGAPAPDRAAGEAPKSFASVEEAAKALFAAFEANDDAALRAIAGPGAEDLVQDGRDPAVAAQRKELAGAAKAKTALERTPRGTWIVVGERGYPLALPFVEAAGGWRVDAEAGRRELLARRIGEHELEAVGICLAFADAQAAYAREDRDGDGVKEYAQRVSSTPGARDGLHWEDDDDQDAAPVSHALQTIRDALEPTATPKPPPFNGYYWRILPAQGANAPGGAHSYVVNGNMIAGFALLGVPAVHRNTGVMSFLVSHHGKVLEKDLGPDGLRAAAAIEAFDPDTSWTEVDEKTLLDAAGASPEDAPFLDDDGAPAAADLGGPIAPATPAGGAFSGASPAGRTDAAAAPRGTLPGAPGGGAPGGGGNCRPSR